MSTPNLHCTIYDSHMPRIKNLPSDTIQLLCKLINVNNLLHTYANVMQQIDNSSCGVFTIAYATDIAFGFDPKTFQCVFDTNVNSSTKLHKLQKTLHLDLILKHFNVF